MKRPEELDIVLVGAGNLATNLGKALHQAGCRISQVYSRTEESARTLAETLKTAYTTSLPALKNDADIYIVSLKDSALAERLTEIVSGREQSLFVHTAGSIPLNIWEGRADHYGVFYPMQTFSKQREVLFREIPFFLEANQKKDLDLLKRLAGIISGNVYEATSEQRSYLHLSAVFACNFTNHMYALCEKLLKEHNLPFEVMLPLIDETARKVHQLSPAQAQTGPAIRYDSNIIDKQLELLSCNPQMRELYEIISKSIHNL